MSHINSRNSVGRPRGEDWYDSFRQASAALGVPIADLKWAKSNACPHIRGNRIFASVVGWLKKNKRTSEYVNRRRQLELLGKSFVGAYVTLCKALPGPLESDFECVIAALLNTLRPQVESITLCLNPSLAIDPVERAICERLLAEIPKTQPQQEVS